MKDLGQFRGSEQAPQNLKKGGARVAGALIRLWVAWAPAQATVFPAPSNAGTLLGPLRFDVKPFWGLEVEAGLDQKSAAFPVRQLIHFPASGLSLL